ncbi:MAG: gliding motility-associated C-terminal domain-containing protein [Bacteroidota bacterium]
MQLGKLYSILFLTLILGYLTTAQAQNLVKNPSFEQFVLCPGIAPQGSNNVPDWTSFLNYGAINILNTCSSHPSYVVPGNDNCNFQQPKAGQGYSRVLVRSAISGQDIRTYLQGNFSSPLKKDSLYCVSFWLNQINGSNWSSNAVGAYINDTLLAFNNGLTNVLLGFTPQIKSSIQINDTLNWQQVSGIYKAHGGEMHITIGNFLSDAASGSSFIHVINACNVNFQPPTTDDLGYYVDEVNVTPFVLRRPNLGKDTLLCQNQMPLLLTAPLGYDSIKWSTGVTTQTINATQAGTYWVKCTANGCGSLTDTIKVKTTSSLPTTVLKDTILCQNQGTLILNAPPGFSSYLWNTGIYTQSISATQSGTYHFTANYACGIFKDTVIVTFNASPLPPTANDTAFCQNNLDLHLNVEGQNILWYETATSTITTTAPILSSETAQVYTFYLTQSINNCESNKHTVSVTIFPIPEITLPIDTVVCEKKLATIGVPYNPLYFYLWNTEQTSSFIVADTGGLYTLQVKNKCGGVNKSIQVTFEKCDKCLFIPNAFTPNNDGLNDEFEVKTVCPIEFYNLKIYNRWGQKIAECNSPQAKWSGEKNNVLEQQDVYVYVIDVTYKNQLTEHYVGHITLLK